MARGLWADDIKARNGCGPGPYILLSEYDALLAADARKEARIAQLEAALMLLTDGFKYSTDVVTIAREALAQSETRDEHGQLLCQHTDSRVDSFGNWWCNLCGGILMGPTSKIKGEQT